MSNENQKSVIEGIKRIQQEIKRTGQRPAACYVYESGVYFQPAKEDSDIPNFTLVKAEKDEHFKSNISSEKQERSGF